MNLFICKNIQSQEIMKNTTLLDKSGAFEKYAVNTDKILELLEKFGFSKNESKIYALIGKHGAKTASEIKTHLGIPRSEVYRILNVLQTKGMLQVSYDSTTVFSIIHPKKVLQLLIEEEKSRLKVLEDDKKVFLKLWEDIPNFVSENVKSSNSVFQTLNGHTQINSRLKEMIKTSKKEFLLLGSNKDFVRFYHDGIFDLLVKSKLEQKILGTKLNELKEFFKGINQKNIRTISKEEQNNQCFAISDRCEVIFFTTEIKSKKPIAMFTNSKSILESLYMLFDFMWSYNEESKNKSVRNKQTIDSEFKLNELKQEMLITDEINQFLIQKIDQKK